MNVGIFVYEQAEVLDFSGPFEVFSTASRISRQRRPFDIFLVGETGETVQARNGYRIIPSYGFDDHPGIEVLIVPGGVHTCEMGKPRVLRWIAEAAGKSTVTASVCTGVFLLAEAKVITRGSVTTHWEDIPRLRRKYPDLAVRESVRWVDEGSVVTSAGISAGIDMSLHLVARLKSVKLAERTARQMEYCWTDKSGETGK